MNADLALSVTMTTVSTILSMGFLPLNLYIYSYAAYHDVSTSTGQDVLATIDFGGIFLSLGIVIAAIGTGILCSWKIDTPHWHRIAYLGGNVSGIALIIWSTFLSFYPFDNSTPTPDEVVTDKHKIHYFAIMLPCILGLIAATCISTGIRLPKPERLTTAVECCYQNTGIATSAAFSLFSGDSEALSQAMRVPVIYGLVEAVAIGLYLVSFWKLGWSKAPKNERICTVITRSYELYEDKGEGDGHEVDYAQDEGENFEDNDDVGTEMARIASEKSGKESMEADVVS
jgi:sodium/bile acid cotransporter 2